MNLNYFYTSFRTADTWLRKTRSINAVPSRFPHFIPTPTFKQFRGNRAANKAARREHFGLPQSKIEKLYRLRNDLETVPFMGACDFQSAFYTVVEWLVKFNRV